MQGAPSEPQVEKQRGSFFLVDVPTFHRVCQEGDADLAAAYIIIAAGTGGGGNVSSWCRQAIENRLCINWRKADTCTAKLEKLGLLAWQGKNGRRPRIHLKLVETRREPSPKMTSLIQRVKDGQQPLSSEANLAERAVATGWLRMEGAQFLYRERSRAETAYLPLSLIGDEKGNPTPDSSIVERIRKTRDPMIFHLLVSLYASQDLISAAGVDRSHLRAQFTKTTFGATSSYSISRFADAGQWTSWGDLFWVHRDEDAKAGEAGKVFFERVGLLEDAGALEWAYYLAEDAGNDATLIYPVALARHGKVITEAPETHVGRLALGAALALVDRADEFEIQFSRFPREFILPADRLYKQAVLVGVPRLRARPKTRATSAWLADHSSLCDDWAKCFLGLIADRAPELARTIIGEKADFKEASMRFQG